MLNLNVKRKKAAPNYVETALFYWGYVLLTTAYKTRQF
jgi:hypothetical protein